MNKPINKIIICLLAAIFLLTLSAFASEDKPVSASSETINVIKLLEIANGDESGNMNYEKPVTRAEFVKMAINASANKETAANIRLNISLFPDVKNSYWGAGYISVAINNGLVTGYIDGTFKPNNNVTLEEAVTIVLRLLGYTNADLIGTYPSAQLQKYTDLELDDGIYAIKGDNLTREECMILIYNALSAKTKQGSVYCETLGYSVNNEGKLDYIALLEDKLSSPIIVADTENIFDDTEFSENKNTKYILNNTEADKTSVKSGDVVYYSEIINTVFIYRKTATGIVTSSNNSTVTVSGKTFNIATSLAKSKFSLGGEFNESKAFVTLILGINDNVVDVVKGDIDRISENDDNTTLLSMIEATISNAVYIKDSSTAERWKSLVPFSTDDARIYLNGKEVLNPTIVAHDVLYHSKAFSSIWIYRNTVSGAIEDITPVTSPTTVTVSGKSYSIATSDAAYDLSLYGAFKVGDKATLILGLNDECVALESTAVTSKLLYGVVTGTGEKEYTDSDGEKYTADYVTVTDTTNSTYTYEHPKRFIDVGDIVKVVVGDTVTITKLSTEIGRGTAAILSDAIKNGKFSDECEIIETNGTDVIKVIPSRISGIQIDADLFEYSSPILYCSFDDEGYISRMILKNLTGDIDEYGVVLSSSNGRIEYLTGKTKKTFTTEGSGCSKGAAKFVVENGNIVAASSLLGCIEDIFAITSSAIYDEKDKEYLVDDDVKVFITTATGFEYSSIAEIVAGDYKYKAYFDKLPENGGRIRVITATRKV